MFKVSFNWTKLPTARIMAVTMQETGSNYCRRWEGGREKMNNNERRKKCASGYDSVHLYVKKSTPMTTSQ